MKRISVALTLMLAALLPGADVLYAWEKAPPFTLPRLDAEEQVSLDDFRGQIVVLDFFNAGCGDCFRASRELELGIHEHYAARSGNPHGFPVQVVAVNSEVAEQEDLETFLEETDLGLVLDDPKGALLQRYGGAGMPYLVVIDATVAEPAAAPRVVLRQAKYEGLKKIRAAIDAITGEVPAAIPGAAPDSEAALSLPALETERQAASEATLDTAAMVASDILVADLISEYRLKQPSMEFSLAASYRKTRMDFKTETLGLRRSRRLSGERFGVQGSARFDLGETLEWKVDGGAYDGFQTYRALWMNEYYRHRIDALNLFGDSGTEYRKAHPRGYNASSGLRWEYLPGAGFAGAGVSYQRDHVSPGCQEGTPFVWLRDTFDTIGGHVSFENVPLRRLRTLLEGRLDDTTDRKPRLTLQGALNYALAENWVMRLAAGYAKERPHFTAKSASAAIERDWHSVWFVSVFGRYYEDTSELETGMANVTAAPPLKTYQVGLGVRRRGDRSTIKLDIGPCFSRYEPHPQCNTELDQLYKDRDWLSLQIAFQHRF